MPSNHFLSHIERKTSGAFKGSAWIKESICSRLYTKSIPYNTLGKEIQIRFAQNLEFLGGRYQKLQKEDKRWPLIDMEALNSEWQIFESLVWLPSTVKGEFSELLKNVKRIPCNKTFWSKSSYLQFCGH